ncbi:MAG: SDR family NAD(P)-dependent oxidoreductase [Chloroflexi bacterium]|nr:SDR family NAD(P)-dependent oxidoreductase [Chloroflexota bacterium]MBU1751780.1 SDR family NAD(P)-dependent oxidoreductase [Chloroflexota bacterium]
MRRLTGKVAVVTGASRGGGRGIALVLGEEGATVYVTGRSLRGASTREDLPGTTVPDTAEQVTARGGVGIPVRCDHAVDTDVEWLFERVKRQHGRLDILVNNAWGGYEHYISHESFDAPFWEQPIARFDRMWQAGVRSHMVTTRLALPLTMPNRQGLIVNTTYDTGSRNWDLDQFGPYSVFYDTAKTAINRMTLGMARDLRPHGIAVVALWPGWMNTETMNPTPEDLNVMESVGYIGRAVAALAADPDVMTRTGQLLHTRALGREYGFTDVGGRQLSPWPPDR